MGKRAGVIVTIENKDEALMDMAYILEGLRQSTLACENNLGVGSAALVRHRRAWEKMADDYRRDHIKINVEITPDESEQKSDK